MNQDKKNLNSEQIEAIQHGKGPLLVIAGAGTGKTTVVTERIKYLVLEKQIPPSQILALTFTEKAALEMEERVDMEMPYGYTQMWISTFHSFCDRILRSEALNIGLNVSYKLMTETEAILFAKKNIFKLELDYFRPLGNPEKFLSSLLQHFSRLKDEDVSPKEYLKWANEQSLKQETKDKKEKKLNAKRYLLDADLDEVKKNLELAHAFKAYEDIKSKEGVMDFSDLISNTLKLFRARKNILNYYQNQFKYILVDEFQDTNFAQNELAILLAGENKNITVAGDDDQSIYRFRGAAVSNIIQFRKHFPKAKIIVLTKNYRSTQEILDRSYNLIQNNNPDRLEVKEKIVKKLSSERKLKGEPIEFMFSPKVEDEADKVAKKIREIIKKNEVYKYNDFAILVRANDHAQSFIRALERTGIPYQFLGPGQLFHQEEIKDLIAYLKVLYNFEDSVSMYRVLNMPVFDVSARDIAYLLNYSRKKNISLFETLEIIDETFLKDEVKEKLKQIIGMIERHLKLIQKETGGQILYYFLNDSGLLKKIIEEPDQKKSQNIARFFEKLKSYEQEHEDASVFSVVDWISLAMQLGESPLALETDWTQNNAVNILTAHSSKGLEFPVVFLVNLVTQRFPSRERKEQIPIPQDLIKEILPIGDYHLEEERRLFYVGVTRARDLLFLTSAYFYGEGKRERKISPFIYEILGEETVKKITQKNKEVQKSNQLSLLEWKVPEQNLNNFSSFPSTLSSEPNGNSHLLSPLTYLSYSQIQSFDICPLHYKLKYILKIPTPPSASQSFGISIHSALRDLYKGSSQRRKLTNEDAIGFLKNNWITEGYSSKAHINAAFKKAEKIITNYFKESFNPKQNPLALELPFNFSVRRPNKNVIKIGGRIDRIDQLKTGEIEILDYKTGNNLPSEKEIENNLQLTIYALAANEVKEAILKKKPDEVILSLYYIEENKKLTTKRTKEQLDEAKELLIQKAEEIENSDFSCSKSLFCKKCEYNMLCNSS